MNWDVHCVYINGVADYIYNWLSWDSLIKKNIEKIRIFSIRKYIEM